MFRQDPEISQDEESLPLSLECLAMAIQQTINRPADTFFYLVVPYCTRNSAIAYKPCDASRGQSRSPNMVPFHMFGIISYISVL